MIDQQAAGLQRAWWLTPLLPGMLALLVYWPATGYGYVWDDVALLVDSAELRSDWQTLWHSAFQPFLISGEYFRPLPLLWLGAEQLWFEGRAFVPHLTGVLLHAANSALVALLTANLARHFRYGGHRTLVTGTVAGIVYALHPSLVESAAWISARFDASLTFLCLVALLVDRTVRSVRMRIIGIFILFLAAALCKEMAVGWAAALFFWHLMFAQPGAGWRERLGNIVREGRLATYCAILVAGLIYLAIRTATAGLPHREPMAIGGLEHLRLIANTLGEYLTMTFYPFVGNGPVHRLQAPIEFGRNAWLGTMGFIAYAISAILALGRRATWAVVLPCCFFTALLPVLNLIVLGIKDNYVQERFLTLPLVFFAMWCALTLSWLWFVAATHARAGKLVAGLFAVVWLLLCLTSVRMTRPIWKDDLSLWTFAYHRQPDSHMASTNLLQAYVARDRFAEARELAERLRDRQGGKLWAAQQGAYGYALARLGEFEEGIHYMKGALAGLRDASVYKVTSAQLGTAYLLAGHPREAVEPLEAAIRLANSVEARYLLALAKLTLGDEEQGGRLLEDVLRDLLPPDREARRRQTPLWVAQFKHAAQAAELKKPAAEQPSR
jgi:protein O-mannosyl-transferase